MTIEDPNDQRKLEALAAELTTARAALDAKQHEIDALVASLEARQAQLLYSQKMAALGSLVAGLLHEIKTPIAAISSMQDTLARAAEKLKRELGCAQQPRGVQAALRALDDALAVIGSGSQRTLEIVRRVRRFARADDEDLQSTDLRAELDDTLLLLSHEIKDRIEVVREYEEIPAVECNPGQVNQVFLNLLVNAAQAIAERGTITVATALEQARVRVTISDTGGGIPPEHLARLFQPGFTTKSASVGTGLGLPISKRIIDAHQGTIDVQSKVGEGTAVSITLPVKRSDR